MPVGIKAQDVGLPNALGGQGLEISVILACLCAIAMIYHEPKDGAGIACYLATSFLGSPPDLRVCSGRLLTVMQKRPANVPFAAP